MAINRRALLRSGFTVTAVGAFGATVPISTAAADPRAVARPTMHNCAAWNARPANGTITVLNRTPAYIVVHHTAGGNSNDFSLAHAFSLSRGIQNHHMDTNGWIDSGQQLTNSRGGHITEGRHRSLEILDQGTRHVQGAHVGNHNSETIGIENEGLYTSVDVTPQLWDSLVQLVAYIAQQYDIDPSMIRGHRDFNATQCPGNVLYGRLPELRDAVGAVLGVAVTQPKSWPLLEPGDSGAQVLAAQHLLRSRGATGLAADGAFGLSTFDATAKFAKESGVAYEPCYASRVADESGFVGSSTWPLLVQQVRVGDRSEAAEAARVLLDARGEQAPPDREIDMATWQELLS